jgi:hypothetical protein
MVARTLHYLSIACCAFLLASFGLFVHDQVSHASAGQAGLVATAPEGARVPVDLPAHHVPGQPRRFIDAVAGKLTSPFASVVDSGNPWVRHGIPTLFALAVLGGGLAFLGRWASGRAGHASAQQQPPPPRVI